MSKNVKKLSKKLSKSCKKLSKSCQKVVKKLSKSCQKSCLKCDFKRLGQKAQLAKLPHSYQFLCIVHNSNFWFHFLLHKKALKSFLHSLTICDKVASGNKTQCPLTTLRLWGQPQEKLTLGTWLGSCGIPKKCYLNSFHLWLLERQ